MRQFVTIATNAFMELVRQPVFLLLMTCSAVFEIFLATPYYFAFGDEPKLVKNSTLAVMLLAGLLGAVLSASTSLAREVRTGTALAVLSKPVGRAQFLLAKYFGLVAALLLLTYVNLIAALLASGMAFDAYGATDLYALGFFLLAVVLAYVLGGLSNFFMRRPFASDTVFCLLITLLLAFWVISPHVRQFRGPSETFLALVDWRLIPAAVLVFFALMILAALALACSTRFEIIPTLAICSAFFLVGIMSDYLFGRRAEPVWSADARIELHSPRWTEAQKTLLKEVVERYDTDHSGTLEPAEREAISREDRARMTHAGMGGAVWASVLYGVTPNWQLFWLADALDSDKKTPIQWGYVAKALVYVVCFVGAALCAAVALFEERELA